MTQTRPFAWRAFAALGLTVALGLSMLVSVGASSHREAPLITEDPVADNTDVYAFVSPDKPNTVTLISNWIPFEEPAGGPNFYNFGEDVLYEINIDNDGDAIDDIVYEFRFRTHIRNKDTFLYATGPITSINDPDFNIRQTYTVTKVEDGERTVLGRNLPSPPNKVGRRLWKRYSTLANQGIHDLPGGRQVFAGQRDEAFQFDIGAVFDLGGLRPFNAAHDIPLKPRAGKNGTFGFNVHSIALQVPKHELRESKGQPVIGVYSTTYRRKTRVLTGNGGGGFNGGFQRNSGPWVQVSRLGQPLINEIVIPLRDKNRFNNSEPRDDAQFLDHVQNTALDNTIAALYTPGGGFTCFPDVDGPRNDLVEIFLTGIEGLNQVEGGTPSEMLRLNTSIAPTLPVRAQSRAGLLGGDADGFPNGRRLIDDVIDIELRAAAGATPLGDCNGESPNQDLGDGANANEREQLDAFPYIPGPYGGYQNRHGLTDSIDTHEGE